MWVGNFWFEWLSLCTCSFSFSCATLVWNWQKLLSSAHPPRQKSGRMCRFNMACGGFGLGLVGWDQQLRQSPMTFPVAQGWPERAIWQSIWGTSRAQEEQHIVAKLIQLKDHEAHCVKKPLPTSYKTLRRLRLQPFILLDSGGKWQMWLGCMEGATVGGLFGIFFDSWTADFCWMLRTDLTHLVQQARTWGINPRSISNADSGLAIQFYVFLILNLVP